MARRVLPAPPGPARVTIRWSAMASRTSRISSLRPTKRSCGVGTLDAGVTRRLRWASPPAPPADSAGRVPELELDVVGISEDEERSDRSVGDGFVSDASGVQLSGPVVQVGAAGHPAGDVVQARAALVEAVARALPVLAHPH